MFAKRRANVRNLGFCAYGKGSVIKSRPSQTFFRWGNYKKNKLCETNFSFKLELVMSKSH